MWHRRDFLLSSAASLAALGTCQPSAALTSITRQVLLSNPGTYQSLPRLLTAVCGNSISAQGQWNAVAGTFAYSTKAEIQLANMVGGGPMRFPRITASTRTDRYGTYGYSGQTLATINADIDAQWFAPLDSAGVTPELAIGQALTANSISGGTNVATIKSDIDVWLGKVQTKWPSARILLCTPHLSFSYNTPAIVSIYQSIRDYILGKDNGRTIFVSRIDAYENPASPGTPQVTTITGSISTTTLTVTATDGPIGIGTRLFAASGVTTCTIQTYISGRGGTGTYGISVSQTVASQSMSVSIYTDESVHPNATGSLVNGRTIATTFARIARAWMPNYIWASNNQTLTGSAAASGTNVTGTVPIGTAITGVAAATFVGTALQPGLQEAITGVATVSNSNIMTDLSSTNHGSTALSAPAQISPYVKIQLVSGAENLSLIEFRPRVNDGGGNNFQVYILRSTNDAEQIWQNGDILTYISPPLTPASGSISANVNFIAPKMRLNQDSGGFVTFKVVEQGVYLVA